MQATQPFPALFAVLLALSAPHHATSIPADERLALDGSFSIELEAHWEQLTDTVYKFEESYPICQNWEPAEKRASYSAEDFRPFVPPAGKSVAVGDTWPLDARDFLPFLQQFHPGATDELHHGSFGGQRSRIAAHGAWGCLRSLGPERAEIVLRVHAEFVLDGDGTLGQTSWLTPAQYEGRMIVDRRQGTVTAFTLALPDQSANVDLNVAFGQSFAADIGRIPRMELIGGDALPEAAAEGTESEITLAEARKRLARRFYPFAEVDWLPLEEGLAVSREMDRPLHVILLFGSLEDESC